MEGRNQFTFYRSFAEALRRIKKPADRAKAYDAICDYALYSIEPDMDSLPDAAAIAFELIRPNLDTAKRKSDGGKKQQASAQDANKIHGRYTEDTRKMSARSSEDTDNKKKKEKENKKEIENKCYTPQPPKGGRTADFEKFWAVYPKKVGKQAAKKAFGKVKVPVETLLTAVERQKCSDQWSKDNGQFIPNPATWLNQGRWEDELDMPAPTMGNDDYYAEDQRRSINDLKRLRDSLREGETC